MKEPVRKPREIEHDRLFGSGTFGTSYTRPETPATREYFDNSASAPQSSFTAGGQESVPTFVGSSRPSMGVPGMINTGSFQTGFSYQQGQQQAQPTRPFQSMNGSQQNSQPLFANNQGMQGQPQQNSYQPVFNSNGQVTGQQTGGFQAIPQNQAMTVDDHGVPGFLRRKKS